MFCPPSELPEAWDLADEVPEHMDIGQCLKQALPAADFLRHAQERFPGLHIMQDAHLRTEEPVELELHSWPMFSWEACPGILGEFVRLATRDSEADPAAVCITHWCAFVRKSTGLLPITGRISTSEKLSTRPVFLPLFAAIPARRAREPPGIR